MKYFSLWHFIQNFNGPKPLRIRLNKIDGFIRVRGSEFGHLVLFDHGLFDKICAKIKYVMSEKSDTEDSINHNFGEIRIGSQFFTYCKKIEFS